MSDALQQLMSGLSDELLVTRNLDLLEKCEKDPFFFAREIMGNQPVFPAILDKDVAGDWVQLFDFIYKFASLGPDSINLGVCNSSRNTFKTTLLASKCAYLIARDRNIRILYSTNVHKNSMNFSRALQHQLAHNQKLIEVYGTFEPEGMKSKRQDDESNLWRQDYFTVSGRTANIREPTFTAGSVGKTEVGQHYDVIILDDCVDNENTTTADSIIKTINWFRLVGSLRDKMSKYGPGGCILVVGTRYVDGDLYGFLLGEVSDEKDQQWRNYKSLVLRAVANPECWDEREQRFVNPKLNFPFVLTEKLLNEERSRGSYYFSTQFQNECVSPDDAHFKKEWFQLIPAYDIPDGLSYYVFTDYAFGLDNSNDRTALWVVGLDWERKAYCVDFDVGRWPLNERCKRTVDFAEKYDCRKIAIEQISSNEGIKATLLKMRDERRLRCTLEEIGGRSQESKQLRITSMQPRFEQRRIFFVMRDNMDMIGIKPQFIRLNKDREPDANTDIVKEFIRFPRATHDDIPDALSDIDKIDNSTRSYFFPGAAKRDTQVQGPMVVNGKVLYNSWDDWRKVNVPSESARPQEDWYSRTARRLRVNPGGGPR
jgi:hypothetical protein